MSLELASFIKDLIATNPLGTDPKSQGDDHLRLIKGVLQSQFSGLTQGKAIIRNEDWLNRTLPAGVLDGWPAGNIDTLNTATLVTQFFGINASTSSANPPPGGFVAGDMLLQIVSGTPVCQVYFGWQTEDVHFRFWHGSAWTVWRPLYEEGTRQSYASFGPGYAASTDAGFRRVNRVVHLEGQLQKTSPIVSGDQIAVMPAGFRPQYLTSCPIMALYGAGASQLGVVEFRTSGAVTVTGLITTSGTPAGGGTFMLTGSYVTGA